jgi:hypothetical protein
MAAVNKVVELTKPRIARVNEGAGRSTRVVGFTEQLSG